MLSSLTISAGTLSPGFDSAMMNYTDIMAYANSAITVTPTAADPGATIQVSINGGAFAPVASGSSSGSLALNANPGVLNAVDVRVTAANTVTVKDYNVNVVRQPSLTATKITNNVSAGVLTLSWPLDHTGWNLQIQTNSLAKGLGSNWVDVPGASTANGFTNSINPINGAVFYRLTYP